MRISRKEARQNRIEACRCAAEVMRGTGNDGAIAPRIWSVTVFFEEYILGGAKRTEKPFGPKKAVKLKAVRK